MTSPYLDSKILYDAEPEEEISKTFEIEKRYVGLIELFGENHLPPLIQYNKMIGFIKFQLKKLNQNENIFYISKFTSKNTKRNRYGNFKQVYKTIGVYQNNYSILGKSINVLYHLSSLKKYKINYLELDFFRDLIIACALGYQLNNHTHKNHTINYSIKYQDELRKMTLTKYLEMINCIRNDLILDNDKLKEKMIDNTTKYLKYLLVKVNLYKKIIF